MGHKVFVSYKYKDSNVRRLDNYSKGTVRDYVDYLQNNKFSGDDLNKAESDDTDLSIFKDETIKNKLKDKIRDSSITLVLISPNMVESSVPQKDQWIPWEVSYSLREKNSNDIHSHPNAVIAVVLPDINNSYDYFINYWNYQDENSETHSVRTLKTNNTFKIIENNMFNKKVVSTKIIQGHTVFFGEHSYITTVKWDDFLCDVDSYLTYALSKSSVISDYKLTVSV